MRTFDNVPWPDRVLVAQRLAHIIRVTRQYKTADEVADWLDGIQQPTSDDSVQVGLRLVRDHQHAALAGGAGQGERG